MKSSDLVLFRDICDAIEPTLYQTLQNPDDEFVKDVENGFKFNEYATNGIEYDFDDMQDKLNVTLRYYQRMALYFTKYYFEKMYLVNNNSNNKLTYWMATGSGKTVIMKANIIDYFEYLRDKNPDEIEVIITSPLKELIGQLQIEMSDFFADEFFKDFTFSYKIQTTQGLISRYDNESHEIVGENQFRLLLVDEAHIGLGGKEKGAFVNIRNELTKNTTNSFMFEYSATFYDVKNKKQIDDYAQRIVYEYDYGKFYNDRYGKDFKFGVVKKDTIAEDEDKDIQRNLDTNLEAFHTKIEAFNLYNKEFSKKTFANKPLLVMAGNTVSASKEKSADNEENSDISKIISYLANLDKKSLDKYVDIFNESNGELHLLECSLSSGEILLSFGEDAKPFGLITVGDTKKFLQNNNIQTLIIKGKIISKNLKFVDEDYLFKNIDYSSSPINILIGSRKFSAGWNSFRVSQICLINFGTGSGSTIVQMFGRGVRLKGLNNDGKRSEYRYVKEDEEKNKFLLYSKENRLSREKYEQLKYLETLFIYSLRSTYLSKFVEEDTDIYKKSITFTKEIEVIKNEENNNEPKKLPIFYIDKNSLEVDSDIIIDKIGYTESIFTIDFTLDGNSHQTKLDKLNIDLTIQEEQTIEYKTIEWMESFIEVDYVEKLIHKKLVQNKLSFNGLDYKYIIELLSSKKIVVKYDGVIQHPKQFQKIIIKVVNTFISKVKNKILFSLTKQNYILDKTVSNDDYINQYEVKFIVDKSADVKKVTQRLSKDDSYKLFINNIVSHYYKPLAIDPHANSQSVYETYQQCLTKKYTPNYKNILDSDDTYFKNIQEIKVTPDKLNTYEFKFVCDLQKYISDNQLDAIVLRNKSKGNIGIIAGDGVFYPDFIIWYKDINQQEHIIFCDPKGIRNAETQWKVCEAPYEIKKLEKLWGGEIKIHSFIISNTPKKDVVWTPIKNLDIQQCDVFYNLLFVEDAEYISKIFNGINVDMLLHKAFKSNIENFSQEIINEWLDDNLREEHIKIIEKIMQEENLSQEKSILLYFAIWGKQDKIEEEDRKNLKDELKEHAVNEILGEFVADVFLDSIPYSRTALKIFKYLK